IRTRTEHSPYEWAIPFYELTIPRTNGPFPRTDGPFLFANTLFCVRTDHSVYGRVILITNGLFCVRTVRLAYACYVLCGSGPFCNKWFISGCTRPPGTR